MNEQTPAKPLKWSELTPRESDALVAEKVMGWTRKLEGLMWRDTHGQVLAQTYWSPTTCPKACAEVKARFDNWMITKAKGHESGDYMAVVFVNGTSFTGAAATEEQAVALAALRSVGVEVES